MLPPDHVRDASEEGSKAEERFISFKVDTEEYAVPILRVQEVRNAARYTLIPRAPAYLMGVCSVRGAIVPVIDLRIRFGLPKLPEGGRPVMIVVMVESPTRVRKMAMVADTLVSVHALSSDTIKAPPQLGAKAGLEFASGLVQLDDGIITIINLDKLFNSGELAVMDEATS